ncbi:hypothetical protein [Mesorhizobium sp. KR1-2]
MNNFYSKAVRLEEIRLQVLDLIYECKDIISETDIEELAERTW